MPSGIRADDDPPVRSPIGCASSSRDRYHSSMPAAVCIRDCSIDPLRAHGGVRSAKTGNRGKAGVAAPVAVRSGEQAVVRPAPVSGRSCAVTGAASWVPPARRPTDADVAGHPGDAGSRSGRTRRGVSVSEGKRAREGHTLAASANARAIEIRSCAREGEVAEEMARRATDFRNAWESNAVDVSPKGAVGSSAGGPSRPCARHYRFEVLLSRRRQRQWLHPGSGRIGRSGVFFSSPGGGHRLRRHRTNVRRSRCFRLGDLRVARQTLIAHLVGDAGLRISTDGGTAWRSGHVPLPSFAQRRDAPQSRRCLRLASFSASAMPRALMDLPILPCLRRVSR